MAYNILETWFFKKFSCSGWLEDAAFFAAIDRLVDTFSWHEWPEPLKNRHLRALVEIHQSEKHFVSFCWYLLNVKCNIHSSYCISSSIVGNQISVMLIKSWNSFYCRWTYLLLSSSYSKGNGKEFVHMQKV